MSKRKKSPNGAVTVHGCNGRLRLVWTCPVQKRRRYHYTQLPETKVNRLVAEQKAALIYRDIQWGEYDPSLKKYKSESQLERDRLTVLQLFDRWIDYKSKSVSQRTLEKYLATRKKLTTAYPTAKADEVTEKYCWRWVEGLGRLGIGTTQQKRLIEQLKACYQWGIEQKFVKNNPWVNVYRGLRPAPKQPPKPFTLEEISRILKGFRELRPGYADYVEVLLSTGLRLGECSGLKWRHYDPELQIIWIGEMHVRGQSRPTKSLKQRSISLTPRLIEIFKSRAEGKPNDFIFQTSRGNPIHDGNFRRRHWKPVLEAVGVPYRSPKHTRHTMTSHALSLGMAPAEVARLTGNTPRTIHQNYEGAIASKTQLPDFINC